MPPLVPRWFGRPGPFRKQSARRSCCSRRFFDVSDPGTPCAARYVHPLVFVARVGIPQPLVDLSEARPLMEPRLQTLGEPARRGRTDRRQRGTSSRESPPPGLIVEQLPQRHDNRGTRGNGQRALRNEGILLGNSRVSSMRGSGPAGWKLRRTACLRVMALAGHRTDRIRASSSSPALMTSSTSDSRRNNGRGKKLPRSSVMKQQQKTIHVTPTTVRAHGARLSGNETPPGTMTRTSSTRGRFHRVPWRKRHRKGSRAPPPYGALTRSNRSSFSLRTSRVVLMSEPNSSHSSAAAS